MMRARLLPVVALALSLGIAWAPAALAMDNMEKSNMSKSDAAMKKGHTSAKKGTAAGGMKKNNMGAEKDNMSSEKDNMSSGGMK